MGVTFRESDSLGGGARKTAVESPARVTEVGTVFGRNWRDRIGATPNSTELATSALVFSEPSFTVPNCGLFGVFS